MKLYDQILAGIKTFFGMEADATEAEVHNVITEAKPLAEQVDGVAIAALSEQITSVTARVTGMEGEISDLKTQVETLTAENTTLKADVEAAKTALSEKETLLQAKETELADLKTAYDAKVTALAAQINTLRLGKDLDKNTDTPGHPGANVGNQNKGEKIVPLTDPVTRKILGLPEHN